MPRSALVTGGSHRLGRAIALALARDGRDVAITYRENAAAAGALVDEVRALGRRAAALRADLGCTVALDALLAQCEVEVGPLGCLVNNASVFHPDSALELDLALFEEHMRVNVAAPLFLARALHARRLDGGTGVVINLLDQKLWNPNPDFLSYTLSKAALETATRLLARALAPTLRVVGVAPGISLPAAGQSAASFARAHRATPLGRSSTPEDVAAAVVFLAGAEAVTGTTLIVDGGQHLLPTERDIMFLAT